MRNFKSVGAWLIDLDAGIFLFKLIQVILIYGPDLEQHIQNVF